jgi:hypothetical protein
VFLYESVLYVPYMCPVYVVLISFIYVSLYALCVLRWLEYSTLQFIR